MKALFASRSRRRTPITLDAVPVTEEVLSARDFLALAASNPSQIKSSSIVLPTPGKKGFGAFLVRYTRPIYRTTG